MADLERTTHPKARKTHQCDQCAGAIEPGETYWRYSWLQDGMFVTTSVCEPCFTLARDLHSSGFYGYDEDGREGYPFLPDFEEWEEVRGISPEWAARVDAYIARRSAADPWFREGRPQ